MKTHTRSAYRASTVSLLALGLLVAMAVATPTTSAALDETTTEQIREAAKTVLVHAGNAKSESAIPLVEALLNADTLICSGWVISFDQALKRMAQELTINPEPRRLQLYGELRQLESKVVQACDSVLTADGGHGGHVGSAGGTHGGGEDGTTSPSASGTSGGNPFVPRPGWTIEDEICFRKCLSQRDAVARAEDARREASERSRRLAQEAEDKERDAARAERALAEAENAQAQLRSRTYTGSLTDAQVADLTRLHAKARNREQLRDEATKARQAADEAAARARRAADGLRAAEAALAAARAALEACLENCKAQAHAATIPGSVPARGGPSATDLRTTIRGLEAPGTTTGHVPTPTPGLPASGPVGVPLYHVAPPASVVPAAGQTATPPGAGGVTVPPSAGVRVVPDSPASPVTTIGDGQEIRPQPAIPSAPALGATDTRIIKVEPLRVEPRPGAVIHGSEVTVVPVRPDHGGVTLGGGTGPLPPAPCPGPDCAGRLLLR